MKFGLITDDTDLEELIGLVYSVGKEIEESSKVSLVNMFTLFPFLQINFILGSLDLLQ